MRLRYGNGRGAGKHGHKNYKRHAKHKGRKNEELENDPYDDALADVRLGLGSRLWSSIILPSLDLTFLDNLNLDHRVYLCDNS